MIYTQFPEYTISMTTLTVRNLKTAADQRLEHHSLATILHGAVYGAFELSLVSCHRRVRAYGYQEMNSS